MDSTMLFKLIRKLNQESFRENLEYYGAEKKAYKDGLYFAEKSLVDEYNESIVTDEPLYRIPTSSIVAREALKVIRIQQKEIERLKAADEKLQIIADRWVAIETGTSEDADDFYSFVQDTLSPNET